ncbi:phosphotransferase family protein [Desulfonatronum parangueonense]
MPMRNQKRPTLRMDMSKLEAYLRDQFGSGVRLLDAREIGAQGTQGMKDFGYGKPVFIRFEQDGETREAVLSTMRGDKYGHQFYWDRAAILMFQHETSARMEKHVRPLALGYVNQSEDMIPVNQPREFFILNEMVQGYDYFRDLERIRKTGLEQQDLDRARSFARWLARMHAEKKDDPDLYLRRIRNLIGASECIFGLVDSYPHPYEMFSPERFRDLECRLIDRRWKLRNYAHRLAAVHGDFHPWNVLILPDGDFRVLDRSRGEWGDAADDISTMSCNYLLFGLYDQPRLSGPFEKLYLTFWDEYLELTNDREILEVIGPFYVFRSLVIASPEWYPNHPVNVREGLFRFMENVLADESFAYDRINSYMR